MNFDSYYQPPEPKSEREVVAFCRECDDDQWHVDLAWSKARIERVCQECGESSEVDE